MHPLDAMIANREAKVQRLEKEIAIERGILVGLREARISLNGESAAKSVTERATRRRRGSIPARLAEVLQQENRPMKLSELTERLEPEGFNGPSVASALSRSDSFESLGRGVYQLAGRKEAQK